jgi:cell shape-determining protein MreD
MYFFSLLLAIGLEATILSVPLTLVSIIALSVMQRKEWVYLVAIAAGLLLDSLLFRPLGVSALFFLIAVGLIFLYQKKFETHHMVFGISFSVLAVVGYMLCFGNAHSITTLLITTILSCLLFGLPFFLQKFLTPRKKNFMS